MTQILITVILIGAFAIWTKRGKQPTVTPERIAEPRITATIGREQHQSGQEEDEDEEEDAPTAWVAAATPVGPFHYLLDGPRGNDATDTTAAMMDMMSGPGLCTPVDSRPVTTPISND